MRVESRTTFSVKGLCPEVANDLARLAQASGLSVSALVREALTAYARAVGDVAAASSGPSSDPSCANTARAPSVPVEPEAIASRLRHAHAVLLRRAGALESAGRASDAMGLGVRRSFICGHSKGK